LSKQDPSVPYRIVTDGNGRQYRIGESPESVMGRSRAWMMWLPWIAMMAVSVFEYGYGAAADTLQSHNHWTQSQAFWIVTIWAVFQPMIAFPAGRLRETGVLPVRVAMLLAAAFSAIGFITIANAGLVYASCINMVGKWFPEKRGARTGFVNGGFAYGTLPFIFVFSYWFHPSNFSLVLNLVALYMLLVIGACAVFFKDPPKDWWPAEVDPLKWAQERRAASARTAVKNPPAVGQFTPIQAIRTGQLPLMWLALWMIGNVSLFGSAYQVPFAKSLGFGPLVAASSAGVLSVVNGTGRAAVGWVSDRIGRKQTLLAVLLVEAVAQVGLLYTGKADLEVPFLFMAFLAGFGGGAFFPLFAALTPDYFGENYNAQNYGIVYSAKLASSLVGIGIGASVITAMGWTSAYVIAAALALVSAALATRLRQPQSVPAAVPAHEAAQVRGLTAPGHDAAQVPGLTAPEVAG
jgi:MFS family permease